MSIRIRMLLLCVATLALTLIAQPDGAGTSPPRVPVPPTAGPHPHVIIVSFDGLRPNAIEASHAKVLLALIKESAWTPRAHTIHPSVTLPSHTSMLTGVPVSVHKVWWNSYQPTRGYPAVPTILQIATDAGLTAAMVAGKEKFAHLAPPGPMLNYLMPGSTPKKVFDTAGKYYARMHPDLLFVHCPEPDLTGHAKGWMSLDYLAAVSDADTQFGRFLVTIDAMHHRADLLIIVSADHGGHDRTHGSDRDADMEIPWIAWGAGVKVNTVVQEQVSTMDTAATALWRLGLPVPQAMTGRPVTQAFVDGDSRMEARSSGAIRAAATPRALSTRGGADATP